MTIPFPSHHPLITTTNDIGHRIIMGLLFDAVPDVRAGCGKGVAVLRRRDSAGELESDRGNVRLSVFVFRLLLLFLLLLLLFVVVVVVVVRSF